MTALTGWSTYTAEFPHSERQFSLMLTSGGVGFGALHVQEDGYRPILVTLYTRLYGDTSPGNSVLVRGYFEDDGRMVADTITEAGLLEAKGVAG